MYATCLHCNAALGANDSIEALPIGRRIAFDAQRGRLWVVCRKCERWNLTPFDTRWEAVEQCERAYRDTRVRVSTDQIGLARLRDGTDLVRIGAPQRPEFAAWRYGDQFGRRRRNMALTVGGAAVGTGLAFTGMLAAGVSIAAIFPLLHVVGMASLVKHQIFKAPRLQLPNGDWIAPIGAPRLIEMPSAAEAWGIDIGITSIGPTRESIEPDTWFAKSQSDKNEIGRAQIPGNAAMPLLRRVLPRINRAGARDGMIREGVQLIEAAGGPEQFARWATGKRREWAARSSYGDTGDINYIPEPARLALEMALHEDAERRALEGELSVLEAAWREAEEIASIADNLTLPASVESRLKSLRKRSP